MRWSKVRERKDKSLIDRVILSFDCLEIESCLHGGGTRGLGSSDLRKLFINQSASLFLDE